MAYEKLNRRLIGGDWDIHFVFWCYLFDGGSMKEEALKLADELDALHQYVPSEAPVMIRRLVEELDKLNGCLIAEQEHNEMLQTKPLSDEEMMKAEYEFMYWNRSLDKPLVEISYELGVFKQAVAILRKAWD